MITLFLLSLAGFLVIWTGIFFFIRNRTKKTDIITAARPIVLGILLLGVIAILVQTFVYKIDSPNWILLSMLMVIAFTFGLQTYKLKRK
ncbi:hypothetical protein ACFQ88_05165 [Paenibacillus sp. NPDC056579]|uniref:hypothetical protein n=1 Tax=Paenibacillus sp. NPDC056579 TaxID=3345871 RepID=UPI0036B63250